VLHFFSKICQPKADVNGSCLVGLGLSLHGQIKPLGGPTLGRNFANRDKNGADRKTVVAHHFIKSVALGLGLIVLAQTAVGQSILLDVGDASDDLRSDIRAASLLYVLKDDDASDASPQDFVAAARADYARVVATLYANGYYSSTVSIMVNGREAAGLSPFERLGTVPDVVITIDRGRRFQFGRADVTPVTDATVVPETFATGETAKVGSVRDAASAVVDGWRDAGHAKAQVSGQQITAQHAEAKLDVAIEIDPGPRLRFGELGVEGNVDVRTERVRRIAGLPEGETFSPVEIDRATNRLRRTGAFKSVAVIEGDGIGSDGTQPVTVQVVEQTPRRFGFGGEISSLEGLTLSGFWMRRNFRGGAERLRLEAEIAGIGGDTGGTDTTLTATYRRPAHFGTNTDLNVLAQFQELNEPNFYSRGVTLEFLGTRIVTENLTAEGGIGYIASVDRDANGESRFQFLTLPFNLTWDRRDGPLNPRDGFYLGSNLMPFIGVAGSEHGMRVELDGRAYRTVGDKTVLAFRGQFGSVIGPEISEAPADFLFYSGGGGTVRGHSYQSLGVVNGTNTTGGRSYVGASLEARYEISDSFGLVGFYDYGMIGEDSFPDGDDSHAGAGLGIRYNTSLGPIRFDVATPVSGNGDGVQFYVGIGQAF
jgi:translocation and assembly module TamA